MIWKENPWVWCISFRRVNEPASGKPILFSAPMVRAILEGRKSQTRRVVKPVPGFEHNNICRPDMAVDPWAVGWHGAIDRVGCLQECPHGKPGDRLWVRESYCVGWPVGGGQWSALRPTNYSEDESRAFYRADGEDPPNEPQRSWKNSMFMPRRFSRITLAITEVRVQRVQEISEADARAEGVLLTDELTGCSEDLDGSYRKAYGILWDSIHAKKAKKVAA
jgi:hypothetical protein